MPRPRKCRKVCRLPDINHFGPINGIEKDSSIIMKVDEYETIRLIDLEGMTQQECCERMQVARTTVQAIYNEARKKLADCLVNGRLLHIEGGNYQVCDGTHKGCNRGQGCLWRQQKELETHLYQNKEKELLL